MVWNYGVVAVLAACGGALFYLQFRKLDMDEDKLNMLPKGTVVSTEVSEKLAS